MGFACHIKDGNYHASWTNPFGIERKTTCDFIKVFAINFFRALAQPFFFVAEFAMYHSTIKDTLTIVENGKTLKGRCHRLLGAGSSGKVFKVNFRDDQNNIIVKAVKQMTTSTVTEAITFEREGYFHEMTKGVDKVAGGGQLIRKDNDRFIVMDFYEGDGVQFYSHISNENPIQVFKLVLESCLKLEEMNLFHIDIKPDNLLLKDQALYAADIGGIAFLPPVNEIDKHLKALMELVKKANPIYWEYLPTYFDKPIHQMTTEEKITVFYYCVSSGGHFFGTNFYGCGSHLDLLNNIGNSNRLITETDYEKLIKTARKQNLRNCAMTTLFFLDSYFLNNKNREACIFNSNLLHDKARKAFNNNLLYNIFNDMITSNGSQTLLSFHERLKALESIA